MTAVTEPRLRIVAFADADASAWGAAWHGTGRFLALGTSSAVEVTDAINLEGTEPGDDWRLVSNDSVLEVAPEGEPGIVADGAGFEQLCIVRGQLALEGQWHRIDCLGRRAARAQLALEQLDSLRDFSARFEPGEGLALTAERSRGAAGHDADATTAVLFEAGTPIEVADPRLSTTYTAAGDPARVGLELWLAKQEAEGEAEPYPRRAAGVAVGAAASSAVSGCELHVQPFRCVSASREGAGVYLLMQPR